MPKQITDVKNKLLDAAEKILKTEGYEALSMRKIAKECSIAVGTVYNYVQNKEELVALVMMEDWTQALSDMAGCVQKSESVTQGMCGIYQALQSFVEKYRDIWTQYSQMGGSSSAISSHHIRHPLLCHAPQKSRSSLQRLRNKRSRASVGMEKIF